LIEDLIGDEHLNGHGATCFMFVNT